ncbi:hypothetical protein D3C81_1921560 [compost metagenome]
MGTQHLLVVRRRNIRQRNPLHCADFRHGLKTGRRTDYIQAVVQDHKDRTGYIPHDQALGHNISNAAAFCAFQLDPFTPYILKSTVMDRDTRDIPHRFQPNTDSGTD